MCLTLTQHAFSNKGEQYTYNRTLPLQKMSNFYLHWHDKLEGLRNFTVNRQSFDFVVWHLHCSVHSIFPLPDDPNAPQGPGYAQASTKHCEHTSGYPPGHVIEANCEQDKNESSYQEEHPKADPNYLPSVWRGPHDAHADSDALVSGPDVSINDEYGCGICE